MNDAHLTPGKLLGNMKLQGEWTKAKIAFICYTPFPKGFEEYVVETAQERYFLHSPNNEVRLCQYKNTSFIVVSEVYGFPVGATTVEELIYHGVDTIIGIGYAGAFGAVPVGRSFIAVDTISDLPLASHYGVAENVRCLSDENLLNKLSLAMDQYAYPYEKFTVWNSNSLYRESPHMIDTMKAKECHAVNMDVLSLYAVAPVCSKEAQKDIAYIYVGTVTDSEGDGDKEWDSDLAEVVKGSKENPHDKLVEFMIEKGISHLT